MALSLGATFIFYGSPHRNILLNFSSLKGISPMDRERNLFPAVSPVQPSNMNCGRLATKDVASILYGNVPHKVNFGHLATSAPLFPRLHAVICSL